MMLALALTGCLYIDADFHAERVAEVKGALVPPDSGGPPADPPTLSAVDPPFGTDAGGTEVRVVGGPFDAGDPTLEVRFGDQVATVIAFEADAVVVETPASPVPGAVDVTVSGRAGSGAAPGAFTYWPDATGRVGAVGELVWFSLVGGLWGPDDEDYGRSTVRFVEPGDHQFYKNWAPELDTCVHLVNGVPDYVYEPDLVSIDALDGRATQRSASASIELVWNAADVRFTDYDLEPTQVVPGEIYDLTLEGTLGVPEIHLDGVFPVPHAFELYDPDIAANLPPDITAGHRLQWTADNEADAVLLQVGMLTAEQDAFEEELYCAVRDVGSFTLPASQWTAWAADRQIHILIGRYNTGNGLLPWNQGRIEVASQLWYYGIARSR